MLGYIKAYDFLVVFNAKADSAVSGDAERAVRLR